MPSLIYIARITRSSEELAQGLQSAGHHVKSFAPGEITDDECLLVMTSEAVLAGLQPANVAPGTGYKAETGQELGGVPPPPNMNAHLAAKAAIWNSLKTAAAKESATSRQQPSSVASKIESGSEHFGFIPSEVGLRAHAASQSSADKLEPLPVAQGELSERTGNPSYSPLSLPAKDESRTSSAQTSAISCGKALLLGGRRRLVNGQRYSLFWQTVAIAASMLIFGAIRPSTTDLASGGTKQPTQFDSGSKESTQTASVPRTGATIQPSKSPVTRSSTNVPKTAGPRRHQSDDDFVAEDLTNHFDLHAHSIANLQNSDLKRSAQGSVKKRVVFN